MTREFLVILRITTEEDDDATPLLWPYDDLLAPPEGEPSRYVEYVSGVEVRRS